MWSSRIRINAFRATILHAIPPFRVQRDQEEMSKVFRCIRGTYTHTHTYAVWQLATYIVAYVTHPTHSSHIHFSYGWSMAEQLTVDALPSNRQTKRTLWWFFCISRICVFSRTLQPTLLCVSFDGPSLFAELGIVFVVYSQHSMLVMTWMTQRMDRNHSRYLRGNKTKA